METRQVTQVKIWKLILNPMTDRTEAKRMVAIAYSKEVLANWYKEQFAPEFYKDDNWHKVFKQGSKLEWFNPCDSFDEPSFFGQGVYAEWVDQDDLIRYLSSNPILID